MNEKSVLIITSHYPPNIGGVESHLQALVSGLIKRNWQVIISTYQPLASKKRANFVEKQEGLIIYRVPWFGFNIVHTLTPYPLLEFLYLFPMLLLSSLFVIFKHPEVRVIHCQGLVPASIGLVLKLFGKRVITSIHNLYFYPKKGVFRQVASFIFSSSDLVLGPTEIARKELLSIGVPKEKISKFRYWLDLNIFKPVKIHSKQLRQGFIVFFVGRLIETKGVKEILDIVGKLNQNIKIIIAGDGPLKGRIEESALENKNLQYIGRVENHDLPKYYSAADLVIVPSLVDEGWGFVAMEAICCGTPVIASKKGGLSDVVTEDVGKLINLSSENLKHEIEFYYFHKHKLKTLKKACRKYALANFGEESIKLIIKAYED